MNCPCAKVEMGADGADGAVSSSNRDRGAGKAGIGGCVGAVAALLPEPGDDAGRHDLAFARRLPLRAARCRECHAFDGYLLTELVARPRGCA